MNITRPLLLGTILLVAGCASTQPNMGIAAGQQRLAAAYQDKNTVDRGQADLSAASTALAAAQDEWRRGNREKSDHHLLMAETSLELAAARGLQAKAEQDTTALRSRAVLANSQSRLDASQAQVRSSQTALNTANAQLAGSEAELRSANAQLQALNMQETALGSTLVLRDVVFETDKAALRVGAANRLDPLINYLRLNPAALVRVEGHTDNVGERSYNQQLSLDRANAVKMALTAGGIEFGRIETIGSNFSKPVGSNDTVSGREANRRVEITLLK